ncbi:HSP20-like chaperone [Corchorus capsularis]|uniref:HSP20-like chaperone n=1 Tax=Corchorus capsularis TaxID=210143 RepID=A0A1R3KGK2_COCAP|nr:HSP20-like chaperone [Corchorus capsularis]
MAILSDFNEDQENNNSSSGLSFNGVLDPSNPMGFLESAFNFVSENSDMFKKGSPERKISSLANGLDMENHSWGQSLQEVTINIPVPEGTKSRDVSCEIKMKNLKVGLKGQTPIIEGELFEAVKPNDSYWMMEDQKLISVLLTKCDKMTWWKSLVKGGPEIDTQKAEPEPSKLADLDGETRSAVEKMMFDQRQKQMGLPTSQEIENQEMMKKFMAQNPNFDFSNAKMM